MKKVISLCLVIILIFTFSGCLGGISGDEAKTLIREFFDKIELEDYAGAEQLLHPEVEGGLEAYFADIEEKNNVDFSSISIEKYTRFETAVYDSSVDGAKYSLTMKTTLAKGTATIIVDVVKNDNGYGIYHVSIAAE